MPRSKFLLLSLVVAALALSAGCLELQHAALNVRLDSVQAAEPDVLVLTSHINTPTAPDPRHEGETLSGISRQVDSAFREDDAELLGNMIRQTPEYFPSLPAIIVAVHEAADVTLHFTVALSLGEVTDRLSCLRGALSHSAAAGFCASALPAHAQTISCVPLSEAASQFQLGASISQVDCSLRHCSRSDDNTPFSRVPNSSLSLKDIARLDGQSVQISFSMAFAALPGSSRVLMVQVVDAAGNPLPYAAPALAIQLRAKTRRLNLFLVQSQSPLPESKLSQLASPGSSMVVLTWETPYVSGSDLISIADTVHYPNSTLTEGRNKLYEHAYSEMFLATQTHFFEYFTFIDDDLDMDDTNSAGELRGSNGWRTFENHLLKYHPAIGVATYAWAPRFPKGDLEAQSVAIYDHQVIAYAFSALPLFWPMHVADDITSWWWGCELQNMVAVTLLRPHIMRFNHVRAINTLHRGYPRGGGKEQVMLWGSAMFSSARVQIDSASEFMRIDAAMDMERTGYDYAIAGNLRPFKDSDVLDIHSRLDICHPYILHIPRRLCFVSAHSKIPHQESDFPRIASQILHKHGECSGYDSSANLIKSLLFEHVRLRRVATAEVQNMEQRIFERVIKTFERGGQK